MLNGRTGFVRFYLLATRDNHENFSRSVRFLPRLTGCHELCELMAHTLEGLLAFGGNLHYNRVQTGKGELYWLDRFARNLVVMFPVLCGTSAL